MRIRNITGLLVPFVILALLFAQPAYAQFGEVAGQPHANVSIGSSNSVSFTLVNGGSTPIDFQIIAPASFQSSTANTIPPVVTVTPMNGTIAPGAEFTINVMVSVPSGKNNTPGTQWVGVIQAVVVSNSSGLNGASGANIQEGVAKVLTVTAIAPRPSLLPEAVAAAIIIIAAALIIYFKRFRKAKAASKPASEARAAGGRTTAVRGAKKQAAASTAARRGGRVTARKAAKRPAAARTAGRRARRPSGGSANRSRPRRRVRR